MAHRKAGRWALAVTALALAAVPLRAPAPQWKDVLGAVQAATQNQNAGSGSINALSDSEIAQGLKAALAQGTRAAVNSLGQTDGFWGNLAARIPLPPAVQGVEKTLKQFGLGSLTDQFHLTLNRAAEQAVPVAADVFANAVNKLTLSDVRSILTGPKDSATQYFVRSSSAVLSKKFRPIVVRATAQAGVTSSYKQLSASAGPLAGAFGAPRDLDSYVTQKALDGLFLQVAAEEARIRDNPAARSSEILRKVFGAK